MQTFNEQRTRWWYPRHGSRASGSGRPKTFFPRTMSIFNHFSLVGAFHIKTLKIVALSVKIVNFSVFPKICFKSCWIIVAVSHVSTRSIVSNLNTDGTTHLDFMLFTSIRLAFCIYLLRILYIQFRSSCHRPIK